LRSLHDGRKELKGVPAPTVKDGHSRRAVAIPTIVDTVEVVGHEDTLTVLTSFGSSYGVGTALAAVIKAKRKYRDVEPPRRRATRPEKRPEQLGQRLRRAERC
jgi:hypothetical protein